MICYSAHPRNQIFVKGHGILSFAKNWVKIMVKT